VRPQQKQTIGRNFPQSKKRAHRNEKKANKNEKTQLRKGANKRKSICLTTNMGRHGIATANERASRRNSMNDWVVERARTRLEKRCPKSALANTGSPSHATAWDFPTIMNVKAQCQTEKGGPPGEQQLMLEKKKLEKEKEIRFQVHPKKVV